MSLLRSLFRSSGELSISDLRDPRKWLLEWAAGRRTQAGEHVSETSALGLSAYFACVRAISEDVAKIPLLVYKRTRRRFQSGMQRWVKERDPEHWAYPLLHDKPNAIQSSFSFREIMTMRAVSWGGGFAEIERDNRNRPIALWPIHPSRVTIRRPTSSTLVYDVKSSSGTVTLTPDRILHIRGLGDELNGWSVARLGAESLGLSMAQQTFGSSFFGNGTTPTGVLTHPDELDDDAYDKLRKDWSEMYAGPENAHKPIILEAGMEWKAMGIPPETAQFIESREFQIEEIARWFRMPPHKIQHLLRATFSNIEEQSIEYVVDTLTPWFVRWEQEIKIKLLQDETDVFAEHLILGLLRGDQAKRADYYTRLFNIGVYSQNDIREIENMNAVEFGDTYYVPLNMVRSEIAATLEPEEEEEKRPARKFRREEDDEEEDTDEEDGDEGKPKPPVPPRGRAALNWRRFIASAQSAPKTDGGFVVPEAIARDVVEAMNDFVNRVLSPVFDADAAQIMRKEEKAADRAIARVRGDAAAFAKWIDEFYGPHAQLICDVLKPACTAAGIILGRDPPFDPAGIARAHCETSKEFLRVSFVAGWGSEDLSSFATRRAKELSAEALQGVCS